MPLPFLKNRDDGASMPVETIERDHDEGFDMLDAVAGDVLEAIAKKDKAMLKEALSALVDHIQTQDIEQDQLMKGTV